MDTTSILNALKQERDRINAAIAALSGGSVGNGRRRRSHNTRIETSRSRRPRRKLSAAARKRISDAARARWAKAKKAGRSSL